MRTRAIHLGTIAQEILNIFVLDKSLKTTCTNLRSQQHLPEDNELTHCGLVMQYGDTDLSHHWRRQGWRVLDGTRFLPWYLPVNTVLGKTGFGHPKWEKLGITRLHF